MKKTFICLLVHTIVMFPVEWDDEGEVRTYNQCKFSIEWKAGGWWFVEVPDFGSDEFIHRRVPSPLDIPFIRAIQKYITTYCSDERRFIERCFEIRVGYAPGDEDEDDQ